MIRAIVFDLDGTLIDTERLYAEAFRQAACAVGWRVPPGTYTSLIGLAGPERRRHLAAFVGDAFFDEYYACRDALAAIGIACKPGALALLDRLDALGLPRAVATSASAATARRHLHACGLLRRIDVLITRDHVARGKPSPECFIQAARLLGVPAADCLAVEDSTLGMQAAAAAGMMVALVPDLVTPDAATRVPCHLVLDGLAEVAALLPDPAVQPSLQRARSPTRG